MTTYRSMFKSELRQIAGVSRTTFTRWMRSERQALARLHVPDHAHRLPAKAVEWLDKKYCIF